jgi:hypothetical protein
MRSYNLYSSPRIIRVVNSKRIRRAVHEAHIGKIRNAYKILVKKSEGNRPLIRYM